LFEIFVGVGGFVDGVASAVVEDVVVVEFLVHLRLIEGAFCGLSSEDSARSVVDGVARFFGTGEGGHDNGAIAGVSGQEDGMAGFVEGRFFECKVARGVGAGGSFSVDPLRDVVDDFFARDVVANKVDEFTLASGKDFLEGFEDELVDEEVVHGCEVRTESHVIEVGVSLGSAEGGVDEFFVTGRIGDTPLVEVSFERSELTGGEIVTKSAGPAV